MVLTFWLESCVLLSVWLEADLQAAVDMFLHSMRTHMRTTWRCWYSSAMSLSSRRRSQWPQFVHCSTTWLRFAAMHSNCAWRFNDPLESLLRTLEYGRSVNCKQLIYYKHMIYKTYDYFCLLCCRQFFDCRFDAITLVIRQHVGHLACGRPHSKQGGRFH